MAADVADVNGDRIVDLLVVNFASNNISVFIGRGHGKFAKAVRIGPRAIAPASLDTVTSTFAVAQRFRGLGGAIHAAAHMGSWPRRFRHPHG